MSESLKYFMDEHMRPQIAEQLRLRGIDVETTAEAGRAHQAYSDESQLRYATQTQRVLVTEDSDFVRLSQILRPHASIVYFPVQLSIGSCIEYLELLALTTNPHAGPAGVWKVVRQDPLPDEAGNPSRSRR